MYPRATSGAMRPISLVEIMPRSKPPAMTYEGWQSGASESYALWYEITRPFGWAGWTIEVAVAWARPAASVVR